MTSCASLALRWRSTGASLAIYRRSPLDLPALRWRSTGARRSIYGQLPGEPCANQQRTGFEGRAAAQGVARR